MTRAIRTTQYVFIGLGLLCLLAMLANFLAEGSQFTFTYTCDDAVCNGTTSDSPSGFDTGVVLGLLGIGLEVTAVALGHLATPATIATTRINPVAGQPPYQAAPQQYSQPPFPQGQMPGGHPG